MRLQIRNKDHKYPFDLISVCQNDREHTMEFNAEFFVEQFKRKLTLGRNNNIIVSENKKECW